MVKVRINRVLESADRVRLECMVGTHIFEIDIPKSELSISRVKEEIKRVLRDLLIEKPNHELAGKEFDLEV